MRGTAGTGMDTNGIGLGEATGVLNLPRNQPHGTARGQERVLRLGYSTVGTEMHGTMIKEMAGVNKSPLMQ